MIYTLALSINYVPILLSQETFGLHDTKTSTFENCVDCFSIATEDLPRRHFYFNTYPLLCNITIKSFACFDNFSV